MQGMNLGDRVLSCEPLSIQASLAIMSIIVYNTWYRVHFIFKRCALTDK